MLARSIRDFLRRHPWLLGVLLAPLLLATFAAPASAISKPGGVKVQGQYTAAKVSWTAVSGAATYEVQYSTSSTFSGAKSVKAITTAYGYVNRLSAGKTYYFRVRVSTPATSSWSSKVSFKAYYPAKYPGTENKVEKAINLHADNVSGSTIDLSWTTFSGQYECFRIQVTPAPTTGQPPAVCTNLYTVTGLKKATKYSLKIYTVLASDGSWPDIDLSGASSSISVTTSNYELAAPSGLTQSSQKSTSVTVSWTAPDRMKDTYAYRVQIALNTAMTKSPTWWPTTVSDPTITLTGLKANTAYFVRVIVVTADLAQRSDKSNYVLAKTLIPRGTISGQITGAPAKDTVAVAYNTDGELEAQDELDSSGNYKLSVRPGTYRVRATYIGNGNYYSSWVSATNHPAVTSDQADVITVTLDKTTSVPDTKLAAGAKVKGTVTDERNGNVVAPITVSLLSGSSGDHETIASTVSATGTFTLNGIPDGNYRLRLVYNNGDGYLRETVGVAVNNGNDVTVSDAIMTPKYYAHIYGVTVAGTKRVGYTVHASYTKWVAQSSPVVTRPTMSFQWKRNGAAISGATSSTYKLTKSDKGKRISVTITGRKTGYWTQSKTSGSYLIP